MEKKTLNRNSGSWLGYNASNSARLSAQSRWMGAPFASTISLRSSRHSTYTALSGAAANRARVKELPISSSSAETDPLQAITLIRIEYKEMNARLDFSSWSAK